METYGLGDFLRSLRESKGMTQADLAFGIMDQASLSKIENGHAIPSKRKLVRLLEKLGHSLDSVPKFLLSTVEIEIQKITDELDRVLVERNTIRADELIEELDSKKNFKEDVLNQQYLSYAKVANLINQKGDSNQILELLHETIRLTIPKFDVDCIKKYPLSAEGARALNMLAQVYYSKGETYTAISIMYQLKENFDKNCIDLLEKGRWYPNIIYNLVRYLVEKRDFTGALILCDTGIAVCKETQNYFYLPYINLQKAFCLRGLEKLGECKQLLNSIYYMFEVCGLEADRAYVKEYAESKLGLIL